MIFLLKMLSPRYRARRKAVLSALSQARSARALRRWYGFQDELRDIVYTGLRAMVKRIGERGLDAPQVIRFVPYRPFPSREGETQ